MGLGGRLYLFLLLLVAFALRVSHLEFGLPATYHPDETSAAIQISRALRTYPMLHSYFHPPLLRELAWAVAKLVGNWQAVSSLDVYAIGIMRWISVITGTASVLAVFAVARQVIDPLPSLLATTLFAICPIPVFQSKYGTPDSLMVFLFMLGLWLALELRQKPTSTRYFAGGLVLGLAVAAKYNAAFLLFSLVAAHRQASLEARPGWGRALGIFSVGLGLGLALGFPLVPYEWNDFVRTTLLEADHQFVRGHRGIKVHGSAYYYCFHFIKSVLPAVGPLVLAAILAGLVYLARFGRAGRWILFASALPYYAAMEQVLKLTFSPERYVLPLLPIYFIAAAAGVAAFVDRMALTKRASLCTFLAIAVLLVSVPAYRSVRLVASIEPDTRRTTMDWLIRHVPSDASIAQGGLRSFYPPLTAAQFPRLTQFGRGDTEYSVVSSFDYDEAFAYPIEAASALEFYQRMFERDELVFEAKAPYQSYMIHNPTLRVYHRRDAASLHD